MTGVVFLLVSVAIALIRFRLSPVYPTFNEVNSDFSVYQVVGNSWAYGLLPYRDAWDVKGPSFFLLFGLFARLRPWSVAPPLIALVLLAYASQLVAFAIARLRLGHAAATVSAVVSSVLIYLSVASVPSSFTAEEIAVPGVLLLLWLVSRWLGGARPVAPAWWVLAGAVLGLLFWAKYQVIAPWAAMLFALVLLLVLGPLRGIITGRSLGRVIGLQLAGLVAATAVVLPFYADVLGPMASAYFSANGGGLNLDGELGRESAFATTLIGQNTGTALTLLGVLAVLSLSAIRQAGLLAMVIAFVLSCWASVFVIQHTNNLFVPLSFVAVAVPQLLAAAQSHGRGALRVAAVLMATAALGATVLPIRQAVADYALLGDPDALTCYREPTSTRTVYHSGVGSVFARTAGRRPILSVGTLFAARSMVISHLPMRHPFEFIEPSRAVVIGADRIQTGYLQDRTFDYVWIHVAGLRRSADLTPQIAAARYTAGPERSAQAAALVAHYRPVLVCNNEILLHVR